MVKSISALALLVLLGTAAFTQDKSSGKGGTVGDFQKALGLATEDPPTAQLINSRIETKGDGSQVYGFYFYDTKSKQIFEREVSLTANKVVKDTTKTPDPKIAKDPKDPKKKDEVSKDMLALLEKKVTGKSKLPEGRLMEIAGKLLKDATISEMKYEKVGDNLVITFGDLQINAETGQEMPKAK